MVCMYVWYVCMICVVCMYDMCDMYDGMWDGIYVWYVCLVRIVCTYVWYVGMSVSSLVSDEVIDYRLFAVVLAITSFFPR